MIAEMTANTPRITFVLPGFTDTAVGGYKIVYEYANRLERKGFHVTIYYPQKALEMNSLLQALRPLSWKYKVSKIPSWFALDPNIEKKCGLEINDKDVPDADYVIATESSTAKPVFELSPSKGKKFYLIQGFETWVMPEEEVKRTYTLGMNNITIAKWLKTIVDSTGAQPATCIQNPVNTDIFYPDSAIARKAKTIAVLYHTNENKGFSYAWEAIKLAKQSVPELTVEMFGAYEPPEGLPDWVHFTYKANQSQLHQIYNESALYVCASLLEGYSLTCAEAIACGCPLVLSSFEGAYEFAIDEESALISPLKDPEAMAENIVRLLNDEEMQQRFAKKGFELTHHLNWDDATNAFIEALHNGK